MPSTQAKPITAEEFMEMHFDVPVELVRGEIVYLYGEDGMTRPGPAHGGVCGNVAFALKGWARARNAGWVTTNDSAIQTGRSPDTIRGADVAFLRIESLPEGKLPRERTEIVPALCVEVLSPSNTYSEIANKIEEYLACGVEEVWIVDPDTRTVEIFRSDAPVQRLKEGETLQSRILPAFTCPISEFFEGI